MSKKLVLVVCCAAISYVSINSLTYADEAPTAHHRAQGFFSLRKIVRQEKGLGKLLIIKHPRKSIEKLLKRVATVSKDFDQELEAWNEKEPTLIAEDEGFPPIEKKTRTGMESDVAKSMLLSGGHNFEIRILVAQVQALDYIAHSLEALEDSETGPSRKARLKAIQQTYEKLKGQVYILLGAKK